MSMNGMQMCVYVCEAHMGAPVRCSSTYLCMHVKVPSWHWMAFLSGFILYWLSRVSHWPQNSLILASLALSLPSDYWNHGGCLLCGFCGAELGSSYLCNSCFIHWASSPDWKIFWQDIIWESNKFGKLKMLKWKLESSLLYFYFLF